MYINDGEVKEGEWIVPMVTSYTSIADMESMVSISGIIATGLSNAQKNIKLLVPVFSMDAVIPCSETGWVTDLLAKRRESKFRDYNDKVVGIPLGMTGRLIDIVMYLENNAHHVSKLHDSIDEATIKISMLLNTDMKTEFSIDPREIKIIKANGDNLHDGLSKIFNVKSTIDSITIGGLIRNGAELDIIVNKIDTISKDFNVSDLTSIRDKLKHIDELIVAIIDSGDTYSKTKVQEISGLLDVLISYTNGVATLAFVKTSTSEILRNIDKVL